ncbi:MAG: DASH complex subunit Dad1-domain-containing protein [Linnemannia elongata]|nr:MAG: DASH complex subunit Dad1-domain-containing protein [Linnemannia elongata]
MAITQGINGGQATATSEAAAFEAERNRLITNIQIEMGQVLSNVNILNRNLETIVTIGQEFEQLSQLWKHFHASAFQRAEEERIDRELLAQEEEDDQERSQEQEGYGEEEPQIQEREQGEEQEDV